MRNIVKLFFLVLISVLSACHPILTNNNNNNTNNFVLVLGLLYLNDQSTVGVPACGSLGIAESANTIPASKANTYSMISLIFLENSFTLPLFSVYRPVGCKPTSYQATISASSTLSGTYSYEDPNAPAFPSKYVETQVASGVTKVITNELTYNQKRYITKYSQTCSNTSVSGAAITNYSYDSDNRLVKTVNVTPASCNSAGTPSAERTITVDFNFLTSSTNLSSQVTTTVLGSTTTISTITYSDYILADGKFLGRKSATTNTTNGVAGTSSSATETVTLDSLSRITTYKTVTTTNGASYPITTTSYEYNGNGKVTKLTFKTESSASSSTNTPIDYTYDGNDRMSGWNGGNYSSYTYKSSGELNVNTFTTPTTSAVATFSN